MSLVIEKIDPKRIDSHVDSIVELLNVVFNDVSFCHELFTNKHLKSPFGPSIFFTAKEQGELVGVRIFSRGKLSNGLEFLQAVDTATHPEFQGRGVFKELILTSLNDPEVKGKLLLNFPNEKSFPQYIKYGWKLYHKAHITFGFGIKGWISGTEFDEYKFCDDTELRKLHWRISFGADEKCMVKAAGGGFGIVSQTKLRGIKFIRLHAIYGKMNVKDFVKKACGQFPGSLGFLALDIDSECCELIRQSHMISVSVPSEFKIAVNGDPSSIGNISSLSSDVF